MPGKLLKDLPTLGGGYYLYNDGYIVQYGTYTTTKEGTHIVTFIKPFSDTKYIIFKNRGINQRSSGGADTFCFYNLTQTSASTYNGNGETSFWEASGYIS